MINCEGMERLYRVADKLDRMAEREKETNLYGDRRETFDEKAFDEESSVMNIIRTNNPAILEAFLRANKENQKRREYVDKRNYSETHIPGIEKVIFNEPATIIFWNDGTKTVVKCCEKDSYDREVGFKTALLTKMFSKQALRDMINTYVPKKKEDVNATEATLENETASENSEENPEEILKEKMQPLSETEALPPELEEAMKNESVQEAGEKHDEVCE